MSYGPWVVDHSETLLGAHEVQNSLCGKKGHPMAEASIHSKYVNDGNRGSLHKAAL